MKSYFEIEIKKTVTVFMTACILLVTNFNGNAQLNISLSVRTAPPALPVYDQPFCPGDGYLWVPGYWAYANNNYYWVPGTWVLPPQSGLYWTPGYWGFTNGFYGWHKGYWGSHIGFYGGINYGFGYGGVGYSGGSWSGKTFRYNTAVTHVNSTVVHNTYVDKTVVVKNTTVNNYSFNGQGGVKAKPTSKERKALKEHHVDATSEQTAHETSARSDPNQFASANHGHPQKLTAAKPDNNEQKNDDQKNNDQKNTAAAKDESPENKQDKKIKKDDDRQNDNNQMTKNDQMKIHQDHKAGNADNHGRKKKG